MLHYLEKALWFNIGANIWQWTLSIPGFVGLMLASHSRWHERCEHCWRKGIVPVKDSHHKHCNIHALKHGTVH